VVGLVDPDFKQRILDTAARMLDSMLSLLGRKQMRHRIAQLLDISVIAPEILGDVPVDAWVAMQCHMFVARLAHQICDSII
jgi:hypothetical protein